MTHHRLTIECGLNAIVLFAGCLNSKFLTPGLCRKHAFFQRGMTAKNYIFAV